MPFAMQSICTAIMCLRSTTWELFSADTNRPLEAEAMYRRAINLLPNFVEAHNNLGVVLLDSKRLAEAEAAFRRALELAPEFADAQVNLGIVSAEIKRLAAVEAMRRMRSNRRRPPLMPTLIWASYLRIRCVCQMQKPPSVVRSNFGR